MQRFGGGVADLGGAEVLDGAGVDVIGGHGPLVAHGGIGTEGSAVELDERLADDGLHDAVALLHVHHHCDGDTASGPLRGRRGGVAHGGHVACLAGADEARGGVTERVAIVGVVVRRRGAAAFVTEKVHLRGELAPVATFLFPLREAIVDHLGQQLLGLDERDLDIAVRIAVEGQLTGHALGQAGVERCVLFREFGDEVAVAHALLDHLELCLIAGQEVVQLGDEALHGGDELDEPLGDEHGAEVVALGGSTGHDARYTVHDLVEREVVGLHLFGDDADVRVGLQGTLQSDVRRRSAHELDEVPILTRRVAVALDVSDHLGVDLAGGVEAEGCFDEVVLQVAVDRLGATDHADASADRPVIFGQHGRVRVRVVAADDDERRDAQLLEDLQPLVELFASLELRAPGADHVEAARVAVFVDDVGRQLHVFMLHQSAGAEDEAEETRLGISRLESVEEAGDHVVSARGLSAGEDHARVDRRHGVGRVATLEGHGRHAVSVREEPLDFLFVARCFRRCALYGTHRSAQRHGHLGHIGRPRDL